MLQNKVPVGYVGMLGKNNLGDEAIYLAISRTAESLKLLPSEHADNAPITMLGGGTILPIVHRSRSPYHFVDRDLNVALGIGVAEPDFENQRRAPIDLRWAFGKADIDITSVLYNLGFLGRLIQFVGNRIPAVEITGTYCDRRDFEQAREMLDVVTVRGPRSKRVLSEYGIESKIVGDTALLLEPDEYHSEASKKIIICLRTPGTGRKWTQSKHYITEIMQFCESLPNDIEKVFLPFYPDDIPLHRDLANQTTNARWEDYTSFVDIDGAIEEIASADVVLGEKLHANVFSACCYTPFISLEYAPKNEDFAASIGLDKFNIRIDAVDASTLMALYDDAKTLDEGDIREPVEKYRTRLRENLAKIENY